MRKQSFGKSTLFLVGLLVTCTPAMVHAQSGTTQSGPPPVAAPLVREGDFAIKLNSSLGFGTTDDEVEAESRLADAGISPQNGWIADYPVTPDVIGELQMAIGDAADAGKMPFGSDEALSRFTNVLSDSGLSVAPYSSAGGYEPSQSGSENYPNPSVVNNYYYTEGPPVMTYYTPPPDFYYLYAWVPFPFWCSGFWFPGFFVLHDFHKTVIINRRPVFVSNHFRDVRAQRVFRIDPADRFRGKTFGGIGSSRMSGRISTGVPGSERRIFNNPPPRNIPRAPAGPPRSPGQRMVAPPSRSSAPVPAPAPVPRAARPMPPPGSGAGATPPRRGEMATPPPPSSTLPAPVPAPVPRGGSSGITTPPSRGEMATPSPHVGEGGPPPSRGGEGFNPPSRGGGGPAGRENRR
jgi:hypothetical protein